MSDAAGTQRVPMEQAERLIHLTRGQRAMDFARSLLTDFNGLSEDVVHTQLRLDVGCVKMLL